MDKQDALTRLAKVQSNSRGRWGRMSAHQMLCHLSDSFLAVMGQKHVSSATGILQRSVVKWVALYAPIPWPKGVPTRPEMDQLVGGTPPSVFESDRDALLALIERFTNPDRDFQWSSHPIFGKMPDPDWFRWGYLHIDHHLRQFGV
jgi:hypothetical protein